MQNSQNNTKSFAVILAAGKGTRMKSELPKVLHEVKGKPLIQYVIDSALEAKINNIVVVIGYKGELVESKLNTIYKDKPISLSYVWQHQQLGTGHALKMAESELPAKGANVLVLMGDVPGIAASTMQNTLNQLSKDQAEALVVSMKLEVPGSYGRIIRNSENKITSIVEAKDASEQQLEVNEVNSGIYAFTCESLWPTLKNIKNNNAQGEYYLTDMVSLLLNENKSVSVYVGDNADEFLGINSKEQLSEVKV